MLGLGTSACSQSYQNLDVEGFSALIEMPNIQLVDVRTSEEYTEGHLEGAINIDVKDDSVMSLAKAQLDTAKTVAVYCRSGRRSADAAERL